MNTGRKWNMVPIFSDCWCYSLIFFRTADCYLKFFNIHIYFRTSSATYALNIVQSLNKWFSKLFEGLTIYGSPIKHWRCVSEHIKWAYTNNIKEIFDVPVFECWCCSILISRFLLLQLCFKELASCYVKHKNNLAAWKPTLK